MSEQKKPDYAKLKTPGGVTATPDSGAQPTSYDDDGRAAIVAALKVERALLAVRADATGKRRLAEVDEQLAAHRAK